MELVPRVVIPKSTNPAHYLYNLDLHGFELTKEDMRLMQALDQGSRGYHLIMLAALKIQLSCLGVYWGNVEGVCLAFMASNRYWI